MQCHKCGQNVVENNHTCPSSEAMSEGNAVAILSCAKCGITLGAKAKFCSECGTKVHQPVLCERSGTLNLEDRSEPTDGTDVISSKVNLCRSCKNAPSVDQSHLCSVCSSHINTESGSQGPTQCTEGLTAGDAAPAASKYVSTRAGEQPESAKDKNVSEQANQRYSAKIDYSQDGATAAVDSGATSLLQSKNFATPQNVDSAQEGNMVKRSVQDNNKTNGMQNTNSSTSDWKNNNAFGPGAKLDCSLASSTIPTGNGSVPSTDQGSSVDAPPDNKLAGHEGQNPKHQGATNVSLSQQQEPNRNGANKNKNKMDVPPVPELIKQAHAIMFHVIISKQFKVHNVYQVKMYLQSEEKQHFPHIIHMNFARAFQDLGTLYTATVDVRAFPNYCFKYRYCVINEGKYLWEKIYFSKKTHGKDSLREFTQHRAYLAYKRGHGTGVLKVYEGVAYPEGMDGFFSTIRRFSTFGDLFIADAQLAARYLLPSIHDLIQDIHLSKNGNFKESAEEYMECIKTVVQELSSQTTAYYQKKFASQCISSNILEHLLRHIKCRASTERTVTLALFLLLLVEKWQIALDAENKNALFKALLIKPNLHEKICPDLTDFHFHFGSQMKKQDIASKLSSYITKSHECGSDPSWIYSIPLLHFLRDESVPFQKPQISTEHRTSEWWGISSFRTKVDSFKTTTKLQPWNIPPQEVFEHLKSTVIADPLMLKSFVATLNFGELVQFLSSHPCPPTVVLSSLFYYLHMDSRSVSNRKQEINEILRNSLERLKIDSDLVYLEEGQCIVTIALDFLDEAVCKSKTDNVIVHPLVLMVLFLLDYIARCEQCHNRDQPLSKRYQVAEGNAILFIQKWLTLLNFHYNAEKSFQMYEECLQFCGGISYPELKNTLTDLFSTSITGKIDQMSPGKRLSVCLGQLNQQGVMSTLISAKIPMYLEEALTDGYTFDNQQYSIIAAQMSSLFMYKWSEMVCTEKRGKFEFIFTWKPLSQYLSWKYCEVFMNSLTVEVQQHLEEAHTFILDLMHRTAAADIHVWEVTWLNQHHDDTSRVFKAVVDDGERFKFFLGLRTKELKEFTKVVDDVEYCLAECGKLLNMGDSSDIITRFQEMNKKIDSLCLCDICITPTSPENIQIEDYSPIVKLQGVPEEFMAFVQTGRSHLNSKVFCNLMKSEVSVPTKSEDWWDQVICLWSRTTTKWNYVCNGIKSGEITLIEAKEFFSFLDNDGHKYEKYEKELKKMDSSKDDEWMGERLKQLKCLSELTTLIAVADAIYHLKEEYSQFADQLEDIQTFLNVDMTQELRNLNSAMLQTSQALSKIKGNQIQHLREFGSAACFPFIQWARETMGKGGLREVKVFVELALNYVGDKTMEMNKVRNLQAAIAGYAPFIFQTGDKSVTFLERCCDVCENITADPDLPKKLESTVELLDWFKHIHNFHGSVEKTALAQVDSITSRGILKIGKVLEQADKGMEDLSLSDVVCMEVPADKESEERVYSYQDLLDLQSRLMLVVGHTERCEEHVERFVSVMDGVERLAKLYIHLCHGGCLLFLNWTIKFYCDQSRQVCCIAEFFQSASMDHMLKGFLGHNSVEEYIAEVAAFLEECQSQWQKYVTAKRDEHAELNMYTMKQLVFLQEQLTLHETGHISSHIFPLLSLLRPECKLCNIQQAMEQAMNLLEDRQSEEDDNSTEDSETRLAVQFIQHMRESGFSKQLATKALKNVENLEDLAEGVMWCMDHEDDEDDSTEINTAKHHALQLYEQKGSNEMSLPSMMFRCKEIWKNFLTTVTDTSKDYLSLHHLGRVLHFLASQNSQEFNRNLPEHWQCNRPHLILCPQREVIITVTSLYMLTPKAPLPQIDEVLFCTLETTTEEVEMFFRRAFSLKSCKKGKLYCMACADSLDYEVSDKAEKALKEHINTTEHEYRLVVVCTMENEFSSHITAALEKFRCAAPIPVKQQAVLNYLHSKFTIPEDLPLKSSAGCLDPERLCVRMVKSFRSGMGKTLYINRLIARLMDRNRYLSFLGESDLSESEEDAGNKIQAACPQSITVPLYEKIITAQQIASHLLPLVQQSGLQSHRVIHLDISYEVQEGVDQTLYNLLVLGCITDHRGHVWLRSPKDIYLVEAMPLIEHTQMQESQMLVHQIFGILPSVTCWSPCESLSVIEGNPRIKDMGKHDLLFDDDEFRSEAFQRSYHYLHSLDGGQQPQPYKSTSLFCKPGSKQECLQILIKHCGVRDPSWSELHHFVSFLNKQLQDFEHSVFCGMATSRDLPGFSAFVLRFLIHMSRDFATHSLVMAEESVPALFKVTDPEDSNGLEQYQMRRTWESSPHPYIFFNPDQTSMTFLGFTIDRPTCNLMDQDGSVLERNIMHRRLYNNLSVNGVPLSEDFDSLPRHEKLQRLYQVMGLSYNEMIRGKEVIDPDDTYELTTDNVKKILAIYMRFRCNIPVIIMGETGCGKTRLVKFMCSMQTPQDVSLNTMVLMKVHGGTTALDIQKKVKEAENLAQKIQENFDRRPVYTVLFFDEANTTEAVGAIKEIMCDGALNGKPIQLHKNLKIVAACNPYRKHTPKVIERLEKAGLGYHMSADKTKDKLGRVPMRQLVYRVQPLPQSLLPLVWDFGQLKPMAESMYIRQMVRRYERQETLGDLRPEQFETLCQTLVSSQAFMRKQKDECSFVSLRDADRTLTVCSYFLQQHLLLEELDNKLGQKVGTIDDLMKSLVLALGVCYRAGLRSKEKYDNLIARYLDFEPEQFRLILNSCADILLENVRLGPTIACNQALKENVFMMVVCMELRIPLFLVGKPGSSKSLAKTIVSDAMQGTQAYGVLFKSFKEVQMVSFQCSPLATAEGILATFRQCAHIQQGKDKSKFVSVVVLDEVGLAEDSPKMPLKALHPLLEEGYEVEDIPDQMTERIGTEDGITKEKFEKVAFIGISNWALDPAKMNRGILVQRDVPTEEELVQTARGICSSGESGVLELVGHLLTKLAKAYLRILDEVKNDREFFGLRDFYSMIKMVHAFATQNKRKLTRSEFRTAILRNFGGLNSLDPVPVFEEQLALSDCSHLDDDTDVSYASLLRTALSGVNFGGESRYLLLLTENYGGLRILTDNLLHNRSVVPIFGSSFPKDQEYTQICSNINRIKVCMETGKTVILLNLDNLYESLYDALNQYYSILAGVRYVDLGLGSHRVKCKVHEDFRLILVAEKQTVYEKFPIPLINRLEKHFLTVSNILTEDQKMMQQQLEHWVNDIVHANAGSVQGDVFIGFHPDATASIILTAWEDLENGDSEPDMDRLLKKSQATLLWCATPDAIIRKQDSELTDLYFNQQQHDNLAQFLQAELEQTENTCIMVQVTTHSKLLTDDEMMELEECVPGYKFTLLSLQAFHTQQQFTHQLSLFLGNAMDSHRVLLVQCESGNVYQTLIQCAQYCVQCVWNSQNASCHVVFIVQLPRTASTCFMGFQGGKWHCVHMDELRSPIIPMPSLAQLQSNSPAQLLSAVMTNQMAEDITQQDRSLHPDLVRHLFQNCVQMVVSCIQDTDDDSERAMQRISLLLHFFQDPADSRFYQWILKQVTGVLEEMEASNVNAKQWLARDAAKLEFVRKAGTFRRAWMQSLQQRLVPILAGIVAFLDTNHNLNFLHDSTDMPSWLQELWYNILHDENLCSLKHCDLISTSAHQNKRREFICRRTFQAGSSIPAMLPFSWILLEQIEHLLASTPAQEEAGANFHECSLNDHLQNISMNEQAVPSFFEFYAADLLSTHFRLNPGQHQLLMQCLMNALRQEGMSYESYGLGWALTQMHCILNQARTRLLSILDMTSCHHQAVQLLQEKLSDPQSKIQATDELKEDVLLLSMLVDEVSPQKDVLNTDKQCQNWLDNFNTLAPVISRVMAESEANMDWSGDEDEKGKNYFPYGPQCCQLLDTIRYPWTRVIIVKLFIDYLSPLMEDASKAHTDLKKSSYTLLLTVLGDNPHLKTKETLEKMDKFFKRINTMFIRSLLGDVTSCKHCKTKLEQPPVNLPCDHGICNKCFKEAAKSNKCPECHQEIPQSFSANVAQIYNQSAVEHLVRFQRQTSSFLMALISQLSFAGNVPPEPEALKHIFGYVTRHVQGISKLQTQQLTLFDDQIDPSPVFRSFILRLLLRYSESEVSDFITKFLDEAKAHKVKDENSSTPPFLTELCLLVIHCIENLQYEKEAFEESRSGEISESNYISQCIYIAELLHDVRRVLDSSPLELPTLISLGRLRYALQSCARIMHACFIKPAKPVVVNEDLRDLLLNASRICDMGTTDWPKKFLVKQLCREFGIESYTTLMQLAQHERCLRWLRLEDIQEVEDVPDRYLLCGNGYLDLCTEVALMIRGQGGQVLQKLSLLKPEEKEYLLLLVLHREVAMACVHASEVIQAGIRGNAQTLIKSTEVEIAEDLTNRICTNTLGDTGSPLRVHAGQSLSDQGLVCVLVHFLVVVGTKKQQWDALYPFIRLIHNPQDMLDSFLPSMPQDNVDEVIHALAIDPTQKYSAQNQEVPRIWECPNGHRYVIGNCGNPRDAGKCPSCGVKIGAETYHQAASGNREGSLADRTQPGHTLGAVANRSMQAVPERSLSATACALLRFFTHASLFLASSQQNQVHIVAQMVTPRVIEEELAGFFWGHLQKDIQVLGRVFHKCCDDIYLLLHFMCHRLSKRKLSRPLGLLKTKQQREDWEKMFSETFINPSVQKVDSIIQEGNQMLVSDTRHGQNQLLNLIFEVGEDAVSPSKDAEDLQHSSVPWKYHTRISVDHFFHQFLLHVHGTREKADFFPVLRLLQSELHHMNALYYLMDVLEHQKQLMRQLHRGLTRNEAIKFTINDMIQKKECDGLQELLEVFSKVWSIIKESLISYHCMTEEDGMVQLPSVFHHVNVSGSSPLAVLLPDTRGPGLCSYLLIHYLLVQHNDFMERYCPLVKQRYDQLPEIAVQAITKRHLLGFSPQSDLLPLVLAHCNYSLHLGHAGSNATQLDYDFHGFELQLKNTLLMGKSRIQRHENKSFKIETMVFRSDITTSKLLTKLRNKIGQISMKPRVQREIAHDLRSSIPDICQSIDNLSIALPFVLKQHVKPDQHLYTFMAEKLKLQDAIQSRKAKEYCCMKHIQSLWILLCLQRACVLASHQQEAFDGQGEDLRKDLQDKQKKDLEESLRRMVPERLEQLLWQIFECIMLYLMQQHDENFARPDNYSLHWLVCANLESPLYAEDPQETREGLLTAEDLNRFPQSLTASQAIPAWLAVHSHLYRRLHQAV